jgi:hypothetical protein
MDEESEEEIDEEILFTDFALKRTDPYWKCHIEREIGGQFFRGKIERIDVGKISKQKLYRVRYKDGDIEHMTAAQVEEYRERDRAISLQLVRDGDTLTVSFFSMAGNSVGSPYDFQIFDTAAKLYECICDRLGPRSVKIYNGSQEIPRCSGLRLYQTLTAIMPISQGGRTKKKEKKKQMTRMKSFLRTA